MRLVGRVLFGADAAVRELVSGVIREPTTFTPSDPAMGVVLRERLVGGVVWQMYTEGNIFVSIAATDPRWLGRQTLRTIFEYPFKQLRCDRVTALIAKPNKRSRRLCEGLGFKQEGVLRRLYGNKDGIVYGMLKEECRWING